MHPAAKGHFKQPTSSVESEKFQLLESEKRFPRPQADETVSVSASGFEIMLTPKPVVSSLFRCFLLSHEWIADLTGSKKPSSAYRLRFMCLRQHLPTACALLRPRALSCATSVRIRRMPWWLSWMPWPVRSSHELSNDQTGGELHVTTMVNST